MEPLLQGDPGVLDSPGLPGHKVSSWNPHRSAEGMRCWTYVSLAT